MKLLTSQKIRFFRKLKKTTQAALADTVGINYRHLQKLESGKVDIKVDTLERIASKLDIPACYLMESVPGHKLDTLQLPCPSALLELLPIGVAVIDLHGTLMYCNETVIQALGRKKSELIAKVKPWQCAASPEDEKRLQAFVESAANRKNAEAIFCNLKSENGAITAQKIELQQLPDSLGKPIGYLLLLTKQ